MKKGTESNPQILYISGIFDGLGCVRIETPKKGERSSLYIWITSKHFELMELLQKFGAHIGKKSDGQYRAKWRDQKAYNILRQLTPILTIRREQAKVGMEFFDYKKRNPNIDEDVVYRLRLKLLKKAEEEVI